MKTLYSLLLALLFTCSLSAQNWSETYQNAQKMANQSGRNVVIVFSGSDWCVECIRMDRDIWENEDFSRSADKDFVFYRADFPRRSGNELPEDLSDQNAKLAAEYNKGDQYPLVVVLTPKGNILGQITYKRASAEEYLKELRGFTDKPDKQ